MAPLASGPPCYPAIGTSSSDSRWIGHGRLPDIPAMSPEPWQQSHCRSSSGEAPRRKRTSRYGGGGDASGDIEPARATQRWHCSAPAIARAAPPLRERRVGWLLPQGLPPMSWLAFSCSSPEFIQVSWRRTATSLDSTVAGALRSTFCSFRKMRFGRRCHW
jgi:hypothetical protein